MGDGQPPQGQTYWHQLGDLIGAPSVGGPPTAPPGGRPVADARAPASAASVPSAMGTDLGAFTDRDTVLRVRPMSGPEIVQAFLDDDARLVPDATAPVYVLEPDLGSISPGIARVTRSALRPVLGPDGDDPVGHAIEVRVSTVFGHAHLATLYTTRIATGVDGAPGPTVFVEDRLSRDSRPARVTRTWGARLTVTVMASGMDPEELDARVERALRAEFVSGVQVRGTSGAPVAAPYVLDTVEREAERVKVVRVGQAPEPQRRVTA